MVISSGFGVRHTYLRCSFHKLGASLSLSFLLCKADTAMGLPPRAVSGFEETRDMPGTQPGYRDEDEAVEGIHSPSFMPMI